MDMTTRVAHCIAKGYKQMVAEVPHGPSGLLRQYIKASVDHPHPQERVVMRYSINRGDVLRPVGIAPIPIAGDLLVVAPSQRYVVFKLSCPSSQYDLMERTDSEDPNSDVKTLILRYNNVGEEIDLTKIESVISCGSHMSLIPLLSMCEVVGNVADKL